MRIALIGLKRSGKDTFADIACNEYDFVKIAFADELKKTAQHLFPDEFANNSKPVELLQWFGETMRERDAEVWIKLLDKKLENFSLMDTFYDQSSNIIVTDCRYPNEVKYLKSKGFTVVQIVVDFKEICRRCAETESDFKIDFMAHESESMALNTTEYADIIIENNGTKEEYENNVRLLIRELGGKQNE